MLHYRDISELKMKFLQAVIEKFSLITNISITEARIVEIFHRS